MRTPSFCIAAIWIAALCFGANASAQTTVTVCGDDNAAGGVNLRDAVAIGGRVEFSCGAALAVIRITAPMAITKRTQIDGGGRIQLQGPGTGSVFVATAPLELANIQVKNEGPAAAGIVRGRSVDVVLRGVGTNSTASAYVAGALSAEDSTFEANGAAGGSVGFIIDAERVQLDRTTFSKNADHPLGGGNAAAGRAPLSREVSIDNSVFTDNEASLLAFDASVIIRNSKFARNGPATLDPVGSWGCCAGAVTAVDSRVEIFDSEFVGNESSGFGGAVLTLGTKLRIVRTLFQQNRARVGGAVFSWGQTSTNNIWSTQAGARPDPGLVLSQVRFRQNAGQFGGGAIGWSGSVSGASVLFAQNEAASGGAVAHWGSVILPADFQQAFSELVAMSAPAAQLLQLSRSVFVENKAQVDGAAILGGGAKVALGNALVVRNTLPLSMLQGAALEGADLDLSNSSVVDNLAGGVKVPAAGQRARLVNTIVLRNANFGCNVPVGRIAEVTASLQFPASDCGAMSIADAQLQINYLPVLGGPAGSSGNLSICISEPLVAALDLVGVARSNRGVCAVGAYEPDPAIDPVSGWSGESHGWVRWVLFFLLLLFLMLGFLLVFMLMRRRRRGHHAKAIGHHQQAEFDSRRVGAD